MIVTPPNSIPNHDSGQQLTAQPPLLSSTPPVTTLYAVVVGCSWGKNSIYINLNLPSISLILL